MNPAVCVHVPTLGVALKIQGKFRFVVVEFSNLVSAPLRSRLSSGRVAYPRSCFYTGPLPPSFRRCGCVLPRSC